MTRVKPSETILNLPKEAHPIPCEGRVELAGYHHAPCRREATHSYIFRGQTHYACYYHIQIVEQGEIDNP